MEARYVVLCVDPVSNKVVYINAEGKKSNKAPTGVMVRVTTDPVWSSTPDPPRWRSSHCHETIPTPVINSWPDGPVENFASTIGIHYQPGQSKEVTAAMLLKFRSGTFKTFNLVLGGSAKAVTVPFSKLLGLEDRSVGGPESEFSISINPVNINFPPNRSVTAYQQLTESFKGSLTHPGLDMS